MYCQSSDKIFVVVSNFDFYYNDTASKYSCTANVYLHFLMILLMANKGFTPPPPFHNLYPVCHGYINTSEHRNLDK